MDLIHMAYGLSTPSSCQGAFCFQHMKFNEKEKGKRGLSLQNSRKKESGCLIFECGFEAVRRIFWQKITNQTPLGICLGILL